MLVCVVQTVPRLLSVAVTAAALTGAPLGSTTVPVIAAVICCAEAVGKVATSIARLARKASVSMRNGRVRFTLPPPLETGPLSAIERVSQGTA